MIEYKTENFAFYNADNLEIMLGFKDKEFDFKDGEMKIYIEKIEVE